MKALMFETLSPQLFVVRYEGPADLVPSRQTGLVASLLDAARAGRTGLVLVFGPGVRTLDVSVAMYWHEVLRELDLAALSVVGSSRAVAAAARGFKVASQLMQSRTPVEVFASEASAVAWTGHLVHPPASSELGPGAAAAPASR
jgi:hypothetical protein